MLNSRFRKEKRYQRPIHFGIPEFHDAAVGSFVIRVPLVVIRVPLRWWLKSPSAGRGWDLFFALMILCFSCNIANMQEKNILDIGWVYSSPTSSQLTWGSQNFHPSRFTKDSSLDWSKSSVCPKNDGLGWIIWLNDIGTSHDLNPKEVILYRESIRNALEM